MSTAIIYKDHIVDFSSILKISYSSFLYGFENDMLQKIVFILLYKETSEPKPFINFDLCCMRTKLRT